MGKIKLISIVTAFNHREEVIKYLGKGISYNTDQLQPRGEVFCGHLCLHVLKELNEGEDFQTILNKFY